MFEARYLKLPDGLTTRASPGDGLDRGDGPQNGGDGPQSGGDSAESSDSDTSSESESSSDTEEEEEGRALRLANLQEQVCRRPSSHPGAQVLLCPRLPVWCRPVAGVSNCGPALCS